MFYRLTDRSKDQYSERTMMYASRAGSCGSRAGRTPTGGLWSAIGRAVIAVAPAKAEKRREKAAREARVERWAEVSGNAGMTGRELPPDQVLAADQKINALARQLKKAGLEGSMDELRAKAFMDLLLGTDSRPRPGGPGHAADRRRAAGRVRRDDQPDHPAGYPAGPGRSARRDLRDRPDRPGSRSKYTRSLPSDNSRRSVTILVSITKATPCQPDAHG